MERMNEEWKWRHCDWNVVSSDGLYNKLHKAEKDFDEIFEVKIDFKQLVIGIKCKSFATSTRKVMKERLAVELVGYK